MLRIKRIRILAAAKVMGLLYAIIGLIFGEITVFLSDNLALNLPQLGDELFGLPLRSVLGLAGLIGIPIVYGILGYISGALMAIIYNLVAGWFGGIELEYE